MWITGILANRRIDQQLRECLLLAVSGHKISSKLGHLNDRYFPKPDTQYLIGEIPCWTAALHAKADIEVVESLGAANDP